MRQRGKKKNRYQGSGGRNQLFVFSLTLALTLILSVFAQEKEKQSDSKLISKLDSIFKEIDAIGIKSGMYAEILGTTHDEKNVYSKAEDELFNSASVSKIVTGAASLYYLGINHTFKTEIYVKEKSKKEGVEIFIKSNGDPSINFEKILKIAHDIKQYGISKVDRINIDVSFFDDDELPPSFDYKKTDESFRCSVSAFSIEENAIIITANPSKKVGEPATISFKPSSSYVIVKNNSKTVKKGKDKISITTNSFNNKTKIVVKGEININRKKPVVVKKRIYHPALNAGFVLKKALEEMGIRVNDNVRVVPFTTEGLLSVSTVFSPPFEIILTMMMKESNNFIAEQLVKIIGAKVSGKQGNFPDGINGIKNFLEKEIRLSKSEFNIKNGSGLYNANYYTPHSIVKILRKMYYDSRIGDEFKNTLPVGGVDGTLKNRMKSECLKGQIRAKTGTLNNVMALAGYLHTAGEKDVVFSLFLEGFQLKKNKKKLYEFQEKIMENICQGL